MSELKFQHTSVAASPDVADRNPKSPLKLGKISELCEILGGISTATFYRRLASGELPPLVQIGPNSVRGVIDEYEEYVRKLIAARDLKHIAL